MDGSWTSAILAASQTSLRFMQSWHLWTIIGLLLLILEMLIPAFFFASFGVAARDGEAEQPDGESLLKRADEALYRAKQGGRDRVTRV